MTFSPRLISSSLFVFFWLSSAHGQGCFNWMIPQYSSYTTVSTDGTHIFTSVLVDGTNGGNLRQWLRSLQSDPKSSADAHAKGI